MTEKSTPRQTKRVFLSHTRSDIRLAEAVAERLRNQGFEAWLDSYDIENRGESWEQEIMRVLDRSDSMIALLTPYAYSSSLVRKELQYALFEDRFKDRLLPVLIGGDPSTEEFKRLPWILLQLRSTQINPSEPEDESAEIIVRAFINLVGSSRSTS